MDAAADSPPSSPTHSDGPTIEGGEAMIQILRAIQLQGERQLEEARKTNESLAELNQSFTRMHPVYERMVKEFQVGMQLLTEKIRIGNSSQGKALGNLTEVQTTLDNMHTILLSLQNELDPPQGSVPDLRASYLSSFLTSALLQNQLGLSTEGLNRPRRSAGTAPESSARGKQRAVCGLPPSVGAALGSVEGKLERLLSVPYSAPTTAVPETGMLTPRTTPPPLDMAVVSGVQNSVLVGTKETRQNVASSKPLSQSTTSKRQRSGARVTLVPPSPSRSESSQNPNTIQPAPMPQSPPLHSVTPPSLNIPSSSKVKHHGLKDHNTRETSSEWEEGARPRREDSLDRDWTGDDDEEDDVNEEKGPGDEGQGRDEDGEEEREDDDGEEEREDDDGEEEREDDDGEEEREDDGEGHEEEEGGGRGTSRRAQTKRARKQKKKCPRGAMGRFGNLWTLEVMGRTLLKQ
ncbi:hypothetical protein ONZ45_g16795 [Pleurotus djamor]|nr:hypothetical protein ONZ45_g16795 [Pleurotus djamor]